MPLVAIKMTVTIPFQPVIRKGETVDAGHLQAAFRATFREDWQVAVAMLRDAARLFRENGEPCDCGRPPCPGVTAHDLVWRSLGNAAAELGVMAASWRNLEPTWQPKFRCTWRQWLLVQFAIAYADEAQRQSYAPPADVDRVAAHEKLDDLIGSLAALAMRGERRGGSP